MLIFEFQKMNILVENIHFLKLKKRYVFSPIWIPGFNQTPMLGEFCIFTLQSTSESKYGGRVVFVIGGTQKISKSPFSNALKTNSTQNLSLSHSDRFDIYT